MAEILITIPEGLSERLDKALALAAPEQAALSRSRLARLIAEGAVRGPSGPVTDGKARAETGDYLVEIGAPEPLDAQPEPIPLSIAYEDEDLIVVNKPA
ncbi:RNA pseudouridine synthase, partial [Paracoccus sp. PXZ]